MLNRGWPSKDLRCVPKLVHYYRQVACDAAYLHAYWNMMLSLETCACAKCCCRAASNWTLSWSIRDLPITGLAPGVLDPSNKGCDVLTSRRQKAQLSGSLVSIILAHTPVPRGIRGNAPSLAGTPPSQDRKVPPGLVISCFLEILLPMGISWT